MDLATRVLERLKNRPHANKDFVKISDEMLALCAVLEEERHDRTPHPFDCDCAACDREVEQWIP